MQLGPIGLIGPVGSVGSADQDGLRLLGCLAGLGGEGAEQDQQAADQLGGAQVLVQQEPGGDGGDHRLDVGDHAATGGERWRTETTPVR